MKSDKEKALIAEVNSLPGTLPEIGEASTASTVDPMQTPLWEIDQRFLNPFAPLPPVQVWATMGDRPAIPRQGIITFSAKPKQGKSLSIYALLIPIITGKEFGSVKPSEERPRLVVVFDTEMDTPTLSERYKAQQKQLGDDYLRLMVVPLLEEPKSKRRGVIEAVTELYAPDIVVIDQVARMVNDFNASGENSEFGEWLATYAARRTVLTVIHQNKATDNVQMKGHLGSIMEELAVENYTVSRKTGVYEVKPTNARKSRVDEDSAPFVFALNDSGEIITASAILEQNRAREAEQWRENFKSIFGEDETLTHSEMAKRIMEKEGLGDRAARNKIDNAINAGAITKTGKERRAPYRLTEYVADFAGIEFDD